MWECNARQDSLLSFLEKLCEVCSCTPYTGKTPGFCCWVSFSVLSKDCGVWSVWDHWEVFQVAIVFSSPRLALHEARRKLWLGLPRTFPVPSLYPPWGGSSKSSGYRGQALPPEFPGSCTSSCWGRANLEAPLLQMGCCSSASALGLLLPRPSPQLFLCPVLSTQLGASGFFLLLLFQKKKKN